MFEEAERLLKIIALTIFVIRLFFPFMFHVFLSFT